MPLTKIAKTKLSHCQHNPGNWKLDQEGAVYCPSCGPKECKTYATPKSPAELDWQSGSLPDVETVPRDNRYLAFIENKWGGCQVVTAIPWEDSLNPLRWCSTNCFSLLTDEQQVTHWALITRRIEGTHENS